MKHVTTLVISMHLVLMSCAPWIISASRPRPFSQLTHNPPNPVITPSPIEENPSPVVQRDILSDVESDISNVLSGLGSDLPSWVASGIPNFFQGFPTGDAVASSLGLKSSDLAAVPTNVLNIDPYANWTSSGSNVRFHGNVYKQPNTSVSDLNKLANVFLIDTKITKSPISSNPSRTIHNLTAGIFVVQQPHVAVNTIHLEPAASQGSSGQPGGGGSSNTTGGLAECDSTLQYYGRGQFRCLCPNYQQRTLGGQSNIGDPETQHVR